MIILEQRKIKLLYLAKDYIEANIIKARLSEMEIHSYLFGNNLQIGIGGLPIDSTFSRIYVSENNFTAANEFIQEYKSNLLIKDTRTWTCPYCKESSPITITSCWNCGQDSIKTND